MTMSVAKFVVAVGLAFVVGAATTMATDAHGLDRRVGTGYEAAVSGLADMSIEPLAARVEPDQLDDGSVIVECVGFDVMSQANATVPGLRLASVPKNPIGPSKCQPQGNRRWK
jgi:hypothetical protein